MKKYIIATACVCLAVLTAASFIFGFWSRSPEEGVLKVGFVYAEDESTPYTRNFVQAQRLLAEEYGDRVEVLVKSNVLSREAEEPLRDLIRRGCGVIPDRRNRKNRTAQRKSRKRNEVRLLLLSVVYI